MAQRLSLRQSILALRDRRFLSVLLFGFCSGFPWVLHGSVLTLWLQESGLSRTSIGFVGAITTVYAINWMWAPFIDRIRLPLLYGKYGQRRSWIILCQVAIALLIAAMSLTSPSQNLLLVSMLALGVAVFSATLDISVDAYRITIFAREETDAKMPYAAAMSTIGWFAGYGFIGGALALALGGETLGFPWTTVYRCLVLVYAVLIALTWLTPKPVEEPAVPPPQLDKPGPSMATGQWLERAVLEPKRTLMFLAPGTRQWFEQVALEPFREFFKRCGFQLAFSILLLLMVFRLGEAMLGRMSLVFYIEVGFTTDQISFYQKFFGGLMTAGFSLLGAMINTHYGVIRGLLVAGMAMAGANLLYALIAIVGPNTNLFMLTLVIDNFFQAFATVAFVSFISYFTSRTYTGTQFALMTSISNFGRTTLAAGSGAVIDFLEGDWAVFFVLTTLMVIPGLCLLLWVGKLIKRYSDASASYMSS